MHISPFHSFILHCRSIFFANTKTYRFDRFEPRLLSADQRYFMMINRTSLIIVLLVAIVGIELCQGKMCLITSSTNNQSSFVFKGLRCYQHDSCFGNCPTLESSIVQCASDQTKCWVRRMSADRT